jgi:hypothetical protein
MNMNMLRSSGSKIPALVRSEVFTGGGRKKVKINIVRVIYWVITVNGFEGGYGCFA